MQEMQMWTREDYGGESQIVSNNTAKKQLENFGG
jgi:hypothetical protein